MTSLGRVRRHLGGCSLLVARFVAMWALSGLLAAVIATAAVYGYYHYWPIPPMFSAQTVVPARSYFVWGSDPILIRRSWCASRSGRVDVSSEIINEATGVTITRSLRSRTSYVEEGCQTRLLEVYVPTGLTLDPGTYIYRVTLHIAGSHPLERDTTERAPDVPFRIVWRSPALK